MNWFIRAKPETGKLLSPCRATIPFSHSWRNIPRCGISPLLPFKSNKCFSQQLGSALESEWIYLEPGSEQPLYPSIKSRFVAQDFLSQITFSARSVTGISRQNLYYLILLKRISIYIRRHSSSFIVDEKIK